MGLYAGAAGLIIVLIGFLVFMILFWASRYKRVPPNCILAVYGRVGQNQTVKYILGGGAFVWPLIQDYSYLSLNPAVVSIPLPEAFPKAGIPKNLALNSTVAISTEPAIMNQAAARLMGLPPEQIIALARGAAFKVLQTGLSATTAEQITGDRKNFLSAFQKNAEPELNKLGLSLVNVSISGESGNQD